MHQIINLSLVGCFTPARGKTAQTNREVSGVKIYPYLISEGRRNCMTLWPAQQLNCDSQETCYQI